MARDESSTQPMLIFIPDITGFTKFVNDTEIEHSQHIIEELLEILIDANTIGLNVSEIEGDAILFYRTGDVCSSDELIQQIETMYYRFHTHLKMYEHSRICECGACSTANDLKLKFVLNYGEVGVSQVKEHSKLFGKEVITAHRLLKNDISAPEYALLTQSVLENHEGIQKVEQEGWDNFKKSSGEYDVGNIFYEYATLEHLATTVPSPKIEQFGLKGKKAKVFEITKKVEAPIQNVFNVLSDLSIRHHWSLGLKDSDHLNSKITRTGSTHRCLINDKKSDPFFITHDFKNESNKVMFTETEHKKGISVVYELTSLDEQVTELKSYTLLSGGWLKQMLFNTFFKKKILKDASDSLDNLNDYCVRLIEEGIAESSQVILKRTTH